MQTGAGRHELGEILREAYGQGLLSQASFLSRMDVLTSSVTIDPARLVGDLTLRSPARLREQFTGILYRVVAPRHPPGAMLALDWTGATAEQIIVGRGTDCDLRLEDSAVSRRHAELLFRDGAWVMHDLNSTNGTLLNGEPVVRAQLRPGDDIVFARPRFRVD